MVVVLATVYLMMVPRFLSVLVPMMLVFPRLAHGVGCLWGGGGRGAHPGEAVQRGGGRGGEWTVGGGGLRRSQGQANVQRADRYRLELLMQQQSALRWNGARTFTDSARTYDTGTTAAQLYCPVLTGY
jgi:hypothetical protein